MALPTHRLEPDLVRSDWLSLFYHSNAAPITEPDRCPNPLELVGYLHYRWSLQTIVENSTITPHCLARGSIKEDSDFVSPHVHGLRHQPPLMEHENTP
jgi:hypothetical protein